MNPKALVVIVTYNSKSTIENCLSSLELSKENLDFDCLIVDNASTDDTRSLVAKYRWAEILPLKENLGFAKANNLGIKWGLRKNYQYFALINPDTYVTKNWLSEIIDVFKSQPDFGIVQPMILLNKTDNLINSSGNSLHFLGFSTCQHYEVKYQEDEWQISSIPTASGAAMVIKKEVFEKIGLLNEDFFLYYEDTEFSWRARIFGFDILLAPKALVYHDYLFKKETAFFYQLEKNRLSSWYILFSPKTKILLLPSLILAELGLLLASLLSGQARQKILAWEQFWQNRTKLKKQSIQIQEKRTISDRELAENVFSAQIFLPQKKQPLSFSLVNLFFKAYWALVKNLL